MFNNKCGDCPHENRVATFDFRLSHKTVLSRYLLQKGQTLASLHMIQICPRPTSTTVMYLRIALFLIIGVSFFPFQSFSLTMQTLTLLQYIQR